MAVDAPILLALNRGMVSRLGLARVDVERIALSAEEQINFMPRVLGSASFRPGLSYVGSTFENKQPLNIPFVFSADDMAVIELTNHAMRVRRIEGDGASVHQRKLTAHFRFLVAQPSNFADSIAESRAALALAGIELDIKSQETLTLAPLAPVLEDDFTGSNGAAWNAAKWINIEGKGTAAATIQSNKGQAAIDDGANWALRIESAAGDDLADFDLTFVFETTAGRQFNSIVFRADQWHSAISGTPPDDPSNGYSLYMSETDSTPIFFLRRLDSGVSTQLGSSVSKDWSDGPWNIRLRAFGPYLKAKAWKVGDAEPGTWDIERFSEVHTTGKLMLAFVQGTGAGSRNVLIDDFALQTGYDDYTQIDVSTTQENELYLLGLDGVQDGELVIYYVSTIEDDGTPYKGWALIPGERSLVAEGASNYILAHEIFHNLGLVHTTDTNNLMYPITTDITNVPPDLTAAQVESALGSSSVVPFDASIVAREAVSTAITNGTFTSDLSGWTDVDQSAAISAWVEGDPLAGAQIAQDVGTAIGDMTAGGGLAAAFNGQIHLANSVCARSVNVTSGTIGKDWATPRIVAGFRCYPSSDAGFIGGGNAGAPIRFTLQGSTDNFAANTVTLGVLDTVEPLAGGTDVAEMLSGVSADTAYRYHRILLEFRAEGTPPNIFISEVEFFDPKEGYLGLTGTGFNEARRRQLLTVASEDVSVRHGLRIEVDRGPVTLRVGKSLNAFVLAALSRGDAEDASPTEDGLDQVDTYYFNEAGVETNTYFGRKSPPFETDASTIGWSGFSVSGAKAALGLVAVEGESVAQASESFLHRTIPLTTWNSDHTFPDVHNLCIVMHAFAGTNTANRNVESVTLDPDGAAIPLTRLGDPVIAGEQARRYVEIWGVFGHTLSVGTKVVRTVYNNQTRGSSWISTWTDADGLPTRLASTESTSGTDISAEITIPLDNSPDVLPETTLLTGTHSLAFTPGGDFYVELAAARQYQARVSSIAIEDEGEMVLPTPWAEGTLPLIRYAQSRDVVFVAAAGIYPMRLERRDNESWSIVRYEPEDGPFQVENVGPISIAASAITGDITLTASRSLFRQSHVGALFRLTSFGQEVEATFSGEDQFSDPIRVTGVGADQRAFTHALVGLSGTGTTVTLQRSVGEPGAWLDVSDFTTDGDRTFNDGLDNQIIHYRLGVKSGDYSSGAIDLAIAYATSGTITGVARVTTVASDGVTAGAIVLDPLGGVAGTTSWSEGEWSPRSGWPSATSFHEGRLWWMGNDRMWGSASDAFDVFDDTIEGDSAPISRSIGVGPTERIHWILSLQRLLFGAQLAAFSARSSSFDEPLTPTAFSLRRISTQGTANVDATAVDDNGYYVQAAGSRVYEMSLPDGRFDYSDSDVTSLVPDICEPSIVRLAVQRQPDTRLHAVLSDGTVAVMVTDRNEGVRAWIKIETAPSDVIEDVVVLPGALEDKVYYSVLRGTVRTFERVAQESEARGAVLTTLMDSHVVYQGVATTAITGLSHLAGRTVVAWADGASVDDANGDPLQLTVSSEGVVTLPAAATVAVVGLSYSWRFKSTKLAYAASIGTAVGMRKRLSKVGLVLADTHARGIRYGQSFDVMNDLPAYEDGALVDPDFIWDEYDKDAFAFPGEWTTDSRICLAGASPRPATVLAVPFIIEGHRSF